MERLLSCNPWWEAAVGKDGLREPGVIDQRHRTELHLQADTHAVRPSAPRLASVPAPSGVRRSHADRGWRWMTCMEGQAMLPLCRLSTNMKPSRSRHIANPSRVFLLDHLVSLLLSYHRHVDDRRGYAIRREHALLSELCVP